MSWVKLDDNWDQHVKFSEVGDLAMLLWVRALTYSCRAKSNGLVPRGRIREFVAVRNTKQLEAKLVAAGLWVPCDAGYMIHDFDKYQLVSDKTSAALSDAGRLGAQRRWGDRSQPHSQANGQVSAQAIGNDGHGGDSSSRVRAHAGADAHRASAAGVGSGSNPEEIQSEPVARMVAEIRRHRVFDPLDAVAIAKHHDGWMMTAAQRIEWVLAAIDDCAAKVVGQGFNASELQSRLTGFMRHAKSPRASGVVSSARAVQPAGLPETDDDAPRRVS